ncbi:hypothetical protein A2U01_0023122, partial [Trifolium medium]|nr:hypothetical protein [Trifolium medium]
MQLALLSQQKVVEHQFATNSPHSSHIKDAARADVYSW